MSVVFVVLSRLCKPDFKIDQKFSIGFRSGEFPGQSKTFIVALLNFLHLLGRMAWSKNLLNATPLSG